MIHLLHRRLAQLAERLRDMQEVISSNLVSPTTLKSKKVKSPTELHVRHRKVVMECSERALFLFGASMTWRAYIEEDEDGNECVYIQKFGDTENRELHELVEHDIKESADMVRQLQDYLEEAQSICDERNDD